MLSGIIEKKGGIPEKGYFQLYFGVHKNFTQTKNIEDSQKMSQKALLCVDATHFDAILRLKQGRNVRKIVSKDTFALSDRLQGVKCAGQGAN